VLGEQSGNGRFVHASPLIAGFPTYSFSIRRSLGFAAALPINGIPVGLGLLGSDSADGSVTIGKATTLGVDEASLYDDLQAWVHQKGVFLAPYASTEEHKAYLRVVSRIYLAGEIKVSLHDASNRALGSDVGAAPSVADALAKPTTRPDETSAKAVENYNAALAALNSSLEAPATRPGASLRIAAATARSIVMNETFSPPLVVGYLGFDCCIGPGGALGPPVPTLAVLESGLVARQPTGLATDLALAAIYEQASELRGRSATAAVVARNLDALATHLPQKDVHYQKDPRTQTLVAVQWQRPADATYLTFRTWRGKVRTSLAALGEAAADGDVRAPGIDVLAERGRLKASLEQPQRVAAAAAAETAALSSFLEIFKTN
jgi:hypothetical protein